MSDQNVSPASNVGNMHASHREVDCHCGVHRQPGLFRRTWNKLAETTFVERIMLFTAITDIAMTYYVYNHGCIAFIR